VTVEENPLRLEFLLQATRDLRNTVDLESYLQLVTEVAAEFTRSEGAIMLIADEPNKVFRFLAAPELQRDVLKALEVPFESSIAGRVFASGEPEIIMNVRKDRQHFRVMERATGYETHSMVVVPLIFKGNKIGILEALNRQNNDDYTDEDVTILEILAAPASLLLYNNILENELAKAHHEITQLDRMKSDFISIASHELRTPLGLILGHATFLRESVTEEHYEQIDTIIRSAGRLKEIIESLANVDNFQSGMASLRSRMTSVKSLLLELVDAYQTEAKQKKIILHADLPKNSDLLIIGDAEKISIAVSNLIKNSLTFTNEGGHVFVSAEQVPGYIKIVVIDDGIGIPVNSLSRIFERFYQVESHLTRKHGGMGLGLSVAKVMVELHGGRIWVESVERKGSQFTILLPTDPSQVRAAERVFI
jgi:signal transduction histidine kinase